MFFQNFIQKFKNDGIVQKSRKFNTSKGSCFCRVFVVNLEQENMFPYVLVVPEKCKNGVTLMMESNNLETENLDALLEDAEESALNRFSELVRYIEVPFLMPVLPSGKNQPYNQQLSRECFTKGAEGKISDFELKLVSTINNAKSLAKQKLGIAFDEKIYLHGYSASGCFAQRFALIHPEMVKGLCAGGCIGSVPMPSEEFNYPLGVKDYKELFGKSFDFGEYRKIKQMYYVGEFEDANKVEWRVDEDNQPAPKHDMSYMQRSVPFEEGLKLRKKYGRNLIERGLNQIAELKSMGISIKLNVIKGTGHNNESGFVGVNENISKCAIDGYKMLNDRSLECEK